jgi:hypothetical protein
MTKKFGFDDLYFTVVFTILAMSIFDEIGVIMARGIALAMIPLYVVGVLLHDRAERFAARAYEKHRSQIDGYSDWR